MRLDDICQIDDKLQFSYLKEHYATQRKIINNPIEFEQQLDIDNGERIQMTQCTNESNINEAAFRALIYQPPAPPLDPDELIHRANIARQQMECDLKLIEDRGYHGDSNDTDNGEELHPLLKKSYKDEFDKKLKQLMQDREDIYSEKELTLQREHKTLKEFYLERDEQQQRNIAERQLRQFRHLTEQ